MKYIFVDMDGTIAEYGYPDGRYNGDFQAGDYINKRPIGTLINIILDKWNTSDCAIIVVSQTQNTKGILEKNLWLDRNFNVPYENRLFLKLDEDKSEIIKDYLIKNLGVKINGNVVLIDDNGKNLANAKKLGIECYHPSQLLIEKEEIQNMEPLESDINCENINEPKQDVFVEETPLEDTLENPTCCNCENQTCACDNENILENSEPPSKEIEE